MKYLFALATSLLFTTSCFAYDLNVSSSIDGNPPLPGAVEAGPVFALTTQQAIALAALRVGIRYRQEMEVLMDCVNQSEIEQTTHRDYVEGLEVRVLSPAGSLIHARYIHTSNTASGVGTGVFQSDSLAISGARGGTDLSEAQLQLIRDYAAAHPGEPVPIQLFRVGIADIINGPSTCVTIPGSGVSGTGVITMSAVISN